MDGGQKYIPREKLQALTTQITYQGVCGIPSAPFYKGDTYAFKFTVDCPLALCNLPTGKAVDHGAENQFLQSVMAVYNEEIFSARRWICQVCGKPAKVLYHGMVPFLCSELGPSSDFQPSVWDSVVPICTTAGECDFQAEEVAKQSFRDVLPKAITCSQYGCESCGIVKNVKRCAGCKRIW